MNEDQLVLDIISAIEKAETVLPDDVVNVLTNSKGKEVNPSAVSQYNSILKNVELAKTRKLPICQDTGTMTFYIDVGFDFKYTKEIKKAILKAVPIATSKIPIRSNAVDPFNGKNMETNVGEHIPNIYWNLVEGDTAKIHLLPKGGGSENCSTLAMLKPGEGIKGIKKFIVDHVIKCGGNPCPPTILGIGIGGGAELSMILAKKSLTRKIGSRHPENRIADLELEILDLVNKTNVGVMGYGGVTSVLDVHIEYAARHPASLPLGIVVQCWADRRAEINISAEGRIEVI